MDCVGALDAGNGLGPDPSHSRLRTWPPLSLFSGTVRPLSQLGRGWTPPGLAAAGVADLESLEVSPSCRGTPCWRAEGPPLEAGGRLPTLTLLGTPLSSLLPLRPDRRLHKQTPFSMSLIPALSRSLGRAKVPTAQAAAHSRALAAASPLCAPPVAFWIQSSPTSQRYYPISALPLPRNLWRLPNHHAFCPSLAPLYLSVSQCPLCPP